MSARLRLSVLVSGLGGLFGRDLAGVVDAARRADEAGIDQIVLPDHVAIGPRTDRYPYGRFPLPADEPWLEPLTTLAAMASVTRRIRLGTGVLIAPIRPAVLLAKTAATLDVLSSGRLDLGVGLGWQPEEVEACGVPFAGRGARLDDTLRACRLLWREAPASFASPTVRFHEIRCEPRPVQPGGPPVWLGAAPTPRNAARLAELADGWMAMETDPAALAPAVERLRAAFAAAGRDPARLEVRATARAVRGADGAPDLGRTLEGLDPLAEAGVTSTSFPLAQYARRREDVGPFL